MSTGQFVFFCKQKTAYEMRISDWSSDVCSSDLHAMKALNNYVSAAGLAAAAEAVIVGSHFGLDPLVIVDVLNASTGRNNSTENKLKQQVLSGEFASGFALGLMAKDLRDRKSTRLNSSH